MVKQIIFYFFVLICFLNNVVFAQDRKKTDAQDTLKAPELSWRQNGGWREKRKNERIKERELRRERRQKRLLEKIELSKGDKNPVKNTKSFSNTLQVKYPAGIKKKRYRIDVLASIYIDEIVKHNGFKNRSKIPDKALAGLSFYEGLTVAADSLKKANYDLDIFIHDLGSLADCPDSLILKRKLDSADLVIGAVPPQDLPGLTNYCKKLHVNFISSLSPSDGGVENNKWLTILQPTLRTHCEFIKHHLKKQFKKKPILLLYRNTTGADINAFNYLKADSTIKINFKSLLCNKLPVKKDIAHLLDTGTEQVVLMPVLDLLFSDSLLHLLSTQFPKMHFNVYGMPAWTGLNLQKRYVSFPNMTFNISSPFTYDSLGAAFVYVKDHYDEKFGTQPNEMAYRGFETLLWYGSLIEKYGTIFNEHYNDVSCAPFTKFKIRSRKDGNGKLMYLENVNIHWEQIESSGAN